MQIPYGRKYSNAMSFKDQTAYVIKKIRNTASNFQAPTYIKKGNRRQKQLWDGKKRGSRGLCCVWICYAFCIFGLIIQGTKIINISFKTN